MCWDFLFPVWSVIALPEKILRWISECISTTRFPINMNGESNGFKPGGRGLRQGDPMSPYLFFCLSYGSLLWFDDQHGGRGQFQVLLEGKCDKERITHLCFADDLMIFYRGRKTANSLSGWLSGLGNEDRIRSWNFSYRKRRRFASRATRDEALFRSRSSRSSSPNQAQSTRLQRGGVMTFPAVPPLLW